MATHFARGARQASFDAPQVDDGISVSAPEPLPLSASQTGSFATLRGGQGAVVADRGNAASVAEASRSSRAGRAARRSVRHRETPVKTDRRLFLGIGVAAALVVVAALVLGWRALRSLPTEAPQVEDANRMERAEVSLAQGGGEQAPGIEYDGYLYEAIQDGGSYAFVRTTASGSEPLRLFDLAGTPVSIVLYDGAFVIAENTSSGWDVIAYMLGDGSVASALVGQDGEPVAGEGQLASATLDGDALVLETADGGRQSVPLR